LCIALTCQYHSPLSVSVYLPVSRTLSLTPRPLPFVPFRVTVTRSASLICLRLPLWIPIGSSPVYSYALPDRPLETARHRPKRLESVAQSRTNRRVDLYTCQPKLRQPYFLKRAHWILASLRTQLLFLGSLTRLQNRAHSLRSFTRLSAQAQHARPDSHSREWTTNPTSNSSTSHLRTFAPLDGPLPSPLVLVLVLSHSPLKASATVSTNGSLRSSIPPPVAPGSSYLPSTPAPG
jgi:hypothetical protein